MLKNPVIKENTPQPFAKKTVNQNCSNFVKVVPKWNRKLVKIKEICLMKD